MSEMTIRPDDNLVTLINVFEVDPAKQQELVALLNEGLDKVFRHRPGFVSAHILVSKDGSRVVNYAQWRSPQDIQATLADSAAQEYARRTAELGKPAPVLYSVVSVATAP
ncbi:antibiotic biosynthesis monooxygenase family protein [Streptomyces sp. MUM 178J]|uniref:antibiotic biosynthesis monooxygenase family protein n=1 Tax=Streptomyces sp. MUM 178J TaxID=2791991 RepID=UPI001F03AA7C|nr:antibiotic biosynthesis monooxygenase [Streptomyces sp. MUM 178J]WRQ83085.1 antibiotic biosynthesis monooxygenase [Streptomyces sp. MUM 178J]